jgi:C1A family cysteine protease
MCYKNKKLNYRFNKPDSRDYIHDFSLSKTGLIPVSFSLKNKISTVLDQGALGSCVSNVIAQSILMANIFPSCISRLDHYYYGRVALGIGMPNIYKNYYLNEDVGLNIRTAFKILSSYGYALETSWPYNISQYKTKPKCDQITYKNYNYQFINNNGPGLISNLKSFIITNEAPIVFGLLIYDSFYSNSVTKTGLVPLPNTQKEKYWGNHCMLIIGWDDTKSLFTCVNSWGSGWGDNGYCYLPYNFITNSKLAGDFCGFVYSK